MTEYGAIYKITKKLAETESLKENSELIMEEIMLTKGIFF
jgi:hypothetical protein